MTETHLEIGGRRLRILHPSDIDGLIHRAKEEDELPFWAYLWPASVGLARYLLESENDSLSTGTTALHPPSSDLGPPPSVHCPPSSALELGAGVGLAGIAAALRGWEVVQTDLVPTALRFARVNGFRNGASIPAFVGDWRRFGVRQRFDVIFGSDILYEPKLHSPLFNILRDYLTPGGRILISDPCRVYALQFMARLEDAGWNVRVANAPRRPEDDTEVLIYTATPPPPDETNPDEATSLPEKRPET